MIITTHSENIGKTEELSFLATINLSNQGFHPMNAWDFEMEIDDSLPMFQDGTVSTFSFYQGCSDRFVSHNLITPSDWELYFNFVKPYPKPFFKVREPSRVTFMTSDGISYWKGK